MMFCMIQAFKVIIYNKRGVNYKLERARVRIPISLGHAFQSTPLALPAAAAAVRSKLGVFESSFAWESRWGVCIRWF